MTKKIGRPSKLPAIDLGQVETMAGLGLRQEDIALVLDISPFTLSRWKKHPAFQQAIKKGKEKADAHVVKCLYNKAIGRQALVDANGVTTYINVEPDTTAEIFWLKNRQPDRWRDKHELGGELKQVLKFEFGDEKKDDE